MRILAGVAVLLLACGTAEVARAACDVQLGALSFGVIDITRTNRSAR
jgi:hypothetical protein